MTDFEKYLNPDLISEFPSKIFTVKMQPRGAGFMHTLTPEEREERILSRSCLFIGRAKYDSKRGGTRLGTFGDLKIVKNRLRRKK